MVKVLIVSPHRDDAAFCCSIAMVRLSKIWKVQVANFFTISEYAPFRVGEVESISQLRLHEDQAFANAIGCSLHDLALVDAPQRLGIKVQEISTRRALNESDAAPRAAITKHIVALEPDIIFLPLCIGDHIDHRIAQAATLDTGIGKLAFYEDLPYCSRAEPHAAEARAGELDLDLSPLIVRCPDAKRWKEHCASFYPSQVDRTTMKEIAQFSDRYDGGERFWATPAAAELLRTFSTE